MACEIHQSLLENYRTHVEALNSATIRVTDGKGLPQTDFMPLWNVALVAGEKCSNAYRALSTHTEEHGCRV